MSSPAKPPGQPWPSHCSYADPSDSRTASAARAAREEPGDRGVVFHHPVHLAVTGEGELEPDAEAVKRRVARADHEHRGDARAAVEVVLDRLQGDVVAEPLGLLVRIGVTADVDQQRRVVDGRAFLVVEPDPLGEAKCDQALAQDVLHRLPKPRSTPSDSAATSSASRTRGRLDVSMTWS